MLNGFNVIVERVSPGLRRIIGNISWLFVERIVTMLVSFFLGIYVIRYLGAEGFGQLSYSMSFVALFIPIAGLGLRQIVIRSIVHEEKEALEILGTAFILQLVASFLVFILLIVAIWQFNSQSDIRWINLIIAFGVLLTSFDTIEYWFQSQVIAGDLVIVRTSQLLLSALIKLFFIVYHFPLIAFVWLVTIEQIIKLVGMIGVYFRQHQSMVKWQFNLARGKGMLQDSWPLILTGVMVTIYQKIDQVMLGKMVSVESVGFYAAAVRFSEIWYFIPMVVCSTVFPAIIRSKQRSEAEYYSRLQILYDSMAWISLSITIPITFSAVPLMTLLLGPEYSESGRILMLHIWAGPATFVTVARTNWLMAENYTRFTFFPNLAGLVINISLNLLLIPRFSGVGAAIATLVAYSSTAFINPYHPKVNMNKMLLKAFLIPFRFQQNLNYYKQLMQIIKK